MSLDRIIKVKQTTGSSKTIGGMMMDNDTWYDIVDEAGRIALVNDNEAISLIFATPQQVHISNGNIEILGQAAYDWIVVKKKQNLDGRDIVHGTPRILGTHVYFTSSDDDHTDPHAVGGDSNVNDLVWDHAIGGNNPEVIYLDFNTIINKTYIRQGDLQWKNANQDYLNFLIVPKVTNYTSGSNTNYNLYDGYLIVPAAGDGVIDVASNDMVLVQNTVNEFGNLPAGYWDADWNSDTKQFENITPNANGTGAYNMFGLEVVLFKFMNRRRLLGTNCKDCATEDVSQLGHNMRLKMEAYTVGDDHAWSGNGTLMLYRKKTV